MKLRALDQIHVSAIQPDALRPQQEFEVSKGAGEALLKAHPDKFEVIENEAEAPAEKAAQPLENKAEPAPANKAVTGRKSK